MKIFRSISLAIILACGLSPSAMAQQVSNAQATTAAKTCANNTSCALNSDLNSRLRVLSFGSDASPIDSSASANDNVPSTTISSASKAFLYAWDGSAWDKVSINGGSVSTYVNTQSSVTAFYAANVTTATVLRSGSSFMLSFNVFPSAALSVVSVYDHATACTGTPKLITETGPGYGVQNFVYQPSRLTFSAGVTVCATTAANVSFQNSF